MDGSKVDVWCFFAIKDGVGRFVMYINYPLWAVSEQMPDKYDLSIFPPPNVIEDVELFINNKATFHELPRKQGRKRRIVRTILGEADGRSNALHGGGTGHSGSNVSPGPDVSDAGTREGDGRTKKRRERRVPPSGDQTGNTARAKPIPVVETDAERNKAIQKTLNRPRKKAKQEVHREVDALRGQYQDVDTKTGRVVARGHVDDEAKPKRIKVGGGSINWDHPATKKLVKEIKEAAVAKALPTPEPTGDETVAKKRKPGRPKKEAT